MRLLSNASTQSLQNESRIVKVEMERKDPINQQHVSSVRPLSIDLACHPKSINNSRQQNLAIVNAFSLWL